MTSHHIERTSRQAGMNLDGIRVLTELFRHRWDPIILALLAEQPRRYRELTHEVHDHDGERIANGVLSVALARLTDDGFIAKRPSGLGYALYATTVKADSRVRHLRRLSNIAAQLDPDDSAVDVSTSGNNDGR